MKTIGDILRQELAIHGFRLNGNGLVEYYMNGSLQTASLEETARMVESEIRENQTVCLDLWDEICQTIQSQGGGLSIDSGFEKLFIHSLKDLAKLLEAYDGPRFQKFAQIIKLALDADISEFGYQKVSSIVDLKITIDWTHRLISRLSYVRKLLRYAAGGIDKSSQSHIKLASGVSGPWANLDLPMGERMWTWKDEDENFRGRDMDLRNQRRYQKGLENYNNDGRVGEGHYWRDINLEPSSWENWLDDKENQHRSVLFWN